MLRKCINAISLLFLVPLRQRSCSHLHYLFIRKSTFWAKSLTTTFPLKTLLLLLWLSLLATKSHQKLHHMQYSIPPFLDTNQSEIASRRVVFHYFHVCRENGSVIFISHLSVTLCSCVYGLILHQWQNQSNVSHVPFCWYILLTYSYTSLASASQEFHSSFYWMSAHFTLLPLLTPSVLCMRQCWMPCAVLCYVYKK